MMFDDIEETEAELIGHVKAACDALAFLQEVNLREAVAAGPVKDEWVRHMTALNMARTRLAMAAEYLHDDLNHYNDQMIDAARGEFPSIVELRRTSRSRRQKGSAPHEPTSERAQTGRDHRRARDGGASYERP